MWAKAWTLKLEDFRDHVTEVFVKDEAGDLLNLSGYGARWVVNHENGDIEWSVASGHVVIAMPATLGKLTLSVPRSEIQLLGFKNAKFKFFIDLPGGVGSDLIYMGQAVHVGE